MRSRGPGAGSTDRYNERFGELSSIAHRVAYRLLGSRDDARDVTQEAMARLHVHWRRAEGHAAPWVSKVAANLSIDLIRRRDRAPEPPSRPAPEMDAHVVERIDLVNALAALPRRQREVVVLRYIADLPEDEVAATLGCTAGTVKQHSSRGLAALRGLLHPSPSFDIAPEGS